MWPALMMFWAVSKIVHYGSTCCRGFDHYYCLPKKPLYEVKTIKTPSFDPVKQNWDSLNEQYQSRRGLDPQEDIGAFSMDDNDNANEHNVIGRDTVERVDHYTQLIPETLINTDDEITFISGSEEQNDAILGPWMEETLKNAFLKYA